MEQQVNGMFLNIEDQERFNGWSKEQIYEAYLIEVEARNRMVEENNRLHRVLAAIRFEMKKI